MIAGAAGGQCRAQHALRLVEPYQVDPRRADQRRRLHEATLVGPSTPVLLRLFENRLRVSGTTPLQLARRERQRTRARMRPVPTPGERGDRLAQRSLARFVAP